MMLHSKNYAPITALHWVKKVPGLGFECTVDLFELVTEEGSVLRFTKVDARPFEILNNAAMQSRLNGPLSYPLSSEPKLNSLLCRIDAKLLPHQVC
jgi:hypothetical protein